MNKQGKMEQGVKITLIIVVAVLILVFAGFYIYNQSSPTNTITSNGMATIKATPDIVGVYFNVQTEGATSSEANDKNSEIVDALKTALIKKGFESKQIQTQSFNVYPNYDYNSGQGKIKNYIATHSIRVEVSTENTEKIGQVIDAGIDAGAGISYINFELTQEKQNSYKAESLKLATEDARIKAESIASGLGKNLGNVVSVQSSDFGYYPWRLYDAVGGATAEEAKTATTDIQPGEQEISSSVFVVYRIR